MLENERHHHHHDDDDDQDITMGNLLFTLTQPHPEQEAHTNSTLPASPPEPHLHRHYLHSIGATLTIRQITSRGLSFQLWPAATTFVTLLDRHRRDPTQSPLAKVLPNGRDYHQLSILELGSGTGLVGIAAAVTLGASVTLTDLPHVVPNMRFNAEANAVILGENGGSVMVSGLRWGEAEDVAAVMTEGREYDLIVASDVVYHDHLYDPLLRTLYSLLLGEMESAKMTTSFVMAHLRRWKKESAFFRKARKAFDVEVLFQDSPLEGSRVGVVVYRFSAKKNKNKNKTDGNAQSANDA